MSCRRRGRLRAWSRGRRPEPSLGCGNRNRYTESSSVIGLSRGSEYEGEQMKTNAVHRRFNLLLLVGFMAAFAALAVLQAAKAGPAPPGVPDSIKVDAVHNKVFLIGHATGVQIYTC